MADLFFGVYLDSWIFYWRQGVGWMDKMNYGEG